MGTQNTVESLESRLQRNPGVYVATEDGRIIGVHAAIEHYIACMRPVGVKYGQLAYDAYCLQTGGVSLVSGAKLPTWDDLAPEIKEAWCAAASAVRRAT